MTNDDKLMIENIVGMMNKSPWNKDDQLLLQDVYDMCIDEDIYVVLDKLREQDVERHQLYKHWKERND